LHTSDYQLVLKIHIKTGGSYDISKGLKLARITIDLCTPYGIPMAAYPGPGSRIHTNVPLAI
jgi:hypothetical protein